jgi:endonuclease YncB( thermonuclease family)
MVWPALIGLMGRVAQAQLLIAGLALAALAPWGQAASAATVLSIGDGDTISVLERGQTLKVRLACIDAPETAQSPYGLASRNQLKALLPIGSTVSLRVQAVDRYGRSVAEVMGRGPINLAMVLSGQAFVYRQYLGRCDRQGYLVAERQAQAQRLGVWAVPGGMTRPWQFRHGGVGHSSAGAVPAAASSSAPASRAQAALPNSAKTTCKQIGSFARAQDLLRQGYSSLDSNRDGVACESLR